MKAVLKVVFNSIARAEFEIENPPVLPLEGEIVDFDWAQFIEDEADVEKLEEFRRRDVWRVNVLFKSYFDDQVIVAVALVEGKNYCELVKKGIDADVSMGRRLCFSDCMNNGETSSLFIDFDPLPDGVTGQVVCFLPS